jgi:hypothetical protein
LAPVELLATFFLFFGVAKMAVSLAIPCVKKDEIDILHVSIPDDSTTPLRAYRLASVHLPAKTLSVPKQCQTGWNSSIVPGGGLILLYVCGNAVYSYLISADSRVEYSIHAMISKRPGSIVTAELLDGEVLVCHIDVQDEFYPNTNYQKIEFFTLVKEEDDAKYRWSPVKAAIMGRSSISQEGQNFSIVSIARVPRDPWITDRFYAIAISSSQFVLLKWKVGDARTLSHRVCLFGTAIGGEKMIYDQYPLTIYGPMRHFCHGYSNSLVIREKKRCLVMTYIAPLTGFDPDPPDVLFSPEVKSYKVVQYEKISKERKVWDETIFDEYYPVVKDANPKSTREATLRKSQLPESCTASTIYVRRYGDYDRVWTLYVRNCKSTETANMFIHDNGHYLNRRVCSLSIARMTFGDKACQHFFSPEQLVDLPMVDVDADAPDPVGTMHIYMNAPATATTASQPAPGVDTAAAAVAAAAPAEEVKLENLPPAYLLMPM